jgi:hypothetical protein
MMFRRQLIIGGVGGLAGFALPEAAPSFSRSWSSLVVQRVIYAYVPDVIFDGVDLDAVAEYTQTALLTRKLVGARRLLKYNTDSMFLKAHFRAYVPRDAATIELDRKIVGIFLLCTDYLQGGPAGRRVVVTRSPDPYKSGCSNPLAELNPAT